MTFQITVILELIFYYILIEINLLSKVFIYGLLTREDGKENIHMF